MAERKEKKEKKHNKAYYSAQYQAYKPAQSEKKKREHNYEIPAFDPKDKEAVKKYYAEKYPRPEKKKS